MSAPTNVPLPCPNCRSQNTVKTVESLLTQIHICRDCHRTFVIEKEDLPQAIEDRIPIPYPLEGIPRAAVVFNFNYVWDDEAEEWVRDTGNSGPGFDLLDEGTVTIPSSGQAEARTGITDGTIAPFLAVNYVNTPASSTNNQLTLDPEIAGFPGITYHPDYRRDISPDQWTVFFDSDIPSSVDMRYRFYEVV